MPNVSYLAIMTDLKINEWPISYKDRFLADGRPLFSSILSHQNQYIVNAHVMHLYKMHANTRRKGSEYKE